MVLTGVVAFAACGPKEGAVSSRHKIDQVLAEETVYMDENVYYHHGSHVSEQWHWDGRTLYRIDYIDNGPYSENFFYDGRNRLTRTTVPAYGIRNEFHYDGRRLDSIECFQGDSKYYTLVFFHEGKTLTEMEWRYEPDTKSPLTQKQERAAVCKTLERVMGADIASLLTQPAQGKGAANTTRYRFEWYKDNVTRIDVSGTNANYTVQLAYDDKRNIYRQLFAYSEENDPMYGFEMLSKNNIVSIIMPFRNDDSQQFSYSYIYDGKFPLQRTQTYFYNVINEVDWTVSECRHQRTETFVPLD